MNEEGPLSWICLGPSGAKIHRNQFEIDSKRSYLGSRLHDNGGSAVSGVWVDALAAAGVAALLNLVLGVLLF